ncbi:hypothetical protein NDU88_004829 [Pleurodeles waltl]|uniref:Uncharacterized protein n=1 Tax=Pleurodeles waltl TaxID=8319 RepID=A0AAV7TTN9_PLEWA|nr:hypothetical protein NDU88_004829 [Pleurodeles waltl]
MVVGVAGGRPAIPWGDADQLPQANWCSGSAAYGGARSRGLPCLADLAGSRVWTDWAAVEQELLHVASPAAPPPPPLSVPDYWIWPGTAPGVAGVGLAPGTINGPALQGAQR